VDAIREMVQQRMPFYEKAANIIVPTDGKPVMEIAKHIASVMQRQKS
jgi:shikimate kinase